MVKKDLFVSLLIFSVLKQKITLCVRFSTREATDKERQKEFTYKFAKFSGSSVLKQQIKIARNNFEFSVFKQQMKKVKKDLDGIFLDNGLLNANTGFILFYAI